MKRSLNVLFVLLAMLALAVSACAPAAVTAPPPMDTPVPPTVAPVPLYQQVTLTDSQNGLTGQNPDYTITTVTPVLTGSEDSRVAAFNALTASIVQQAVDDFTTQMTDLQPLPDIGASSMFDLRYKLVSPPGNVLSLQFIMEGYVEGMAHPYHVTRTLNFDLEQGREIALDSLFQPNSDYLTAIANFCIAELQTRDIGFNDMFAPGAAPTAENYQDWNVTADGLLIVFNEYQVAPYAAGPQSVTVPYVELASMINPQGPLAEFLPK